MITIKITLDLSQLKRFQNLDQTFWQEMDTAIFQIAQDVRNTAVTQISRGERSGRLYKRGRILHRASAPGEFPKTDTGRLVSSIYATHKTKTVSEVGSPLNYALFLEEKIPQKGGRPWLSRSYEMVAETSMEQRILAALERVFR